MPRLSPAPIRSVALALALAATACTVVYHRVDDTSDLPETVVRPGITNLLHDSLSVIANKRVGLLSNQASVDERGRRDIDLIGTDKRATGAHVQLVELFSPEHGLDANQDHPNVASTTDRKSGLPVISLFGGTGTEGPSDAAMQGIDVLIVDLQDVGSRTWTYEGALVYSMRAAARAKKPIVVLDRPNPLTGSFVEGPVLDSALANAGTATTPGIAWALYPIPLRHGMTFGELARFYNAELRIGADLHVVPVSRWSREVWFDKTSLPFVAPTPNLQSFKSVILYTGLVPFEASNLSVGRGTAEAFQLIGAPWLDAPKVIAALREHGVRGVRFAPEDFTPSNPGDNKYGGHTVHGIRIEVTERNELQTARLAASMLAAVHRVHPTQLTLDTMRFDRLFGSTIARQQIMAGQDPDAVVDRAYGPAYAFRQRVLKYLLY